MMRSSPRLQRIIRPLVDCRFLLSLGLSVACGILFNTLFPLDESNAMLRLIRYERPQIFDGIAWSYDFFLYSTPFIAFSMLFSLMYVHLYRNEQELAAGTLPPGMVLRSRWPVTILLPMGTMKSMPNDSIGWPQ